MAARSMRLPVGPRRLRRTLGPPFIPTRFDLRADGVTVGATISGIDLRGGLDEATLAELRTAWAEWKVLRFPDQHLSPAELGTLASRFGTVVDDHLQLSAAADPVDNVVDFTRDADTVGLENGWHCDGTFRSRPTAGTFLQAIEVPAVGGDTVFADLAAALDTLPDDLRSSLVGLTARHDWSLGAYADKYGDRLAALRAEVPPVEHPVVVLHPTTRRPTLLVNPLFTDAIVGVDHEVSEAMLERLFHQLDQPEIQHRVRWRPGTLVLWDNLAVAHYGVNDYHPERRVMRRATFLLPDDADLAPWDGADPTPGN